MSNGPMTLEELREQRRRMAHRNRRIVYNNDGDEIMFDGIDSRRKFLDLRTTAVLNTHVDAITYYSTAGMKLHYEHGPFGRLYGLRELGNNGPNYNSILAETGKDTLELLIEAGHDNDIEVFYSNRMNDWHDAFDTDLMYNMRREHPEWLLSTQEEGSKYEYPDVRSCWTAWDFEVAEIRELTVDALKEVCRDYDVDGIELDFLRGTAYFSPTMELRAVEQRHVEILTNMMRQIRQVTEEEGLRRGRPILLMPRITNDVPLSMTIGLDVEKWLEEGLIDLLHIGSWVNFEIPAKPTIDLAHRHDTPVYSIVHGNHKDRTFEDKAVWRGDALWRFSQGADGAYTFNVFDPHLWLWSELGDPAAIEGKDRSYIWDYLESQHHESDVLPRLRISSYRRPVTIDASGGEAMIIFVGEDLSEPPPEGKRRQVKLRVHVTDMAEGQQLALTLNGASLESDDMSESRAEEESSFALSFRVDPGLVKRGENRVEARVLVEGTVTIDDARIDVGFLDADAPDTKENPRPP